MRRLLLISVLLVATMPAIATSQRPPLPPAVWPASVQPGGVVLVRLARIASSATARWFGETYRFTETPDLWWVLLPVPIDAPVGRRPLAVRKVHHDWEDVEEVLQVTIAALKRPTQRLRVSKATNSLYSAAEAKAERAAIGAAIRSDTGPAGWPGPFALPFAGRTTTAFGTRRIRNGREVDWHRGIDLAAPEGTPVHTSAAGTVALIAEHYKLHGKTVVVVHGAGLATVYLHLSRIEVAQGDTVTAGQVVGRVGMTGAATGPHLHWAAYLNGDAINPLALLALPQHLQ